MRQDERNNRDVFRFFSSSSAKFEERRRSAVPMERKSKLKIVTKMFYLNEEKKRLDKMKIDKNRIIAVSFIKRNTENVAFRSFCIDYFSFNLIKYERRFF